MLIANIECDEIINQAVNEHSKRTWIINYMSGETNRNHKSKDKRRLYKILNRAGYIEDIHYTLELDVTYGTLDNIILSAESKLKHIQEVTKCDIMNLWLGPDDGSNFRYKAAKTQPYKGTRPPKPEVLKQLRSYMLNIKSAQVIWGYEADDALGIYQNPIGTTVAVHCDKDIFMIPGIHLNTMTDELIIVDELGALELINGKVKGTGLAFFYFQMLKGDRTDNIPNVQSGYGDVKCYNLLKDCNNEYEYLETVCDIYKGIHEYWKFRLLEQADLVWICREKEETGSGYIRRRYQELFGGGL